MRVHSSSSSSTSTNGEADIPSSYTTTRQSYSQPMHMPKMNNINTLSNKGQKSTRYECEAFLREMELKSANNDNDKLWIEKPNGQLLASLSHVGVGNMSFYTTKGTLLFQGRDGLDIKRAFLEWRKKRLKALHDEDPIHIDTDSAYPEEREPKRQKVQETYEGKPSISTMKNELQSYGVDITAFVERFELEAALKRERAKREENRKGGATSQPQYVHASFGMNSRQTEGSEHSYSTSKQHGTNMQNNAKPDEKECKYCEYPISRHFYFEGDLVCKFTGHYECITCPRKWWGMALKIQSKEPGPGAFPLSTYPDCLTCNVNDNVELREYKRNDFKNECDWSRASRKHCQLCKKGEYCPRAN